MCMDMGCACVRRAQTNRMAECTLYMLCRLYEYHVVLLWRYIDTVIVVAEHVSIDRNPSETGFLRLLLFGKMEQITYMH